LGGGPESSSGRKRAGAKVGGEKWCGSRQV
jgi:hypothetical protein